MPAKTVQQMHVLENLATAIVVLDDALTVTYLNPMAEMLLELSIKRARGMPVQELILEDEGFYADLHEALNTSHPYSVRERTLCLQPGRPITVDCTVTPLHEPGMATSLIIELLPIDRQLRITREEQLIAQQSATRALIRGLAHEIKNPLGGLRGAAQLLERELPEEGLREYTRIIIGEADRLQGLVDRMLGPNDLPKRGDTNIHEALERVRQLVMVEAREGVVLRTDYDPSIPPLIADGDQLVQVFLNIVRNALQSVDEAGTITLRTRVQRQYTIGQTRHKLVASVEIIDDGPGIDAEIREKIFYPMVSGRNEGTGLGLSIAQSLINQHGGLIECDSRPGHTVFTVLIPIKLHP